MRLTADVMGRMQPSQNSLPLKVVAEEPKFKSPHRILVVDDNRDNAMLMRELLEIRGYTVHVAFSAADAERQVAARPPDIILARRSNARQKRL